MLFEEIATHLPAIVVRVILYSYVNQKAHVKWSASVSELCKVKKGPREGKMCSPTFWGIYILPFINKLRNLSLGCHDGEVFMDSILCG